MRSPLALRCSGALAAPSATTEMSPCSLVAGRSSGALLRKSIAFLRTAQFAIAFGVGVQRGEPANRADVLIHLGKVGADVLLADQEMVRGDDGVDHGGRAIALLRLR